MQREETRERTRRQVKSLVGICLLAAIPLLWLGGCLWNRGPWLEGERDGAEGVFQPAALQTEDSVGFPEELKTLLDFVCRKSWGASSPLKIVDPTRKTTYSKEYPYAKVTGIVIHHTASSNTSDDWSKEVRRIQSEHANKIVCEKCTQVHGDIPYHFLIDPNGKVYEGRAWIDDEGKSIKSGLRTTQSGGIEVVLGYHGHQNKMDNGNTVGIAFLGCFLHDQVEFAQEVSKQEGSKEWMKGKPTPQAIESAKKLIKWIAGKAGLSACAIFAHRDVTTEKPVCPGYHVYTLLPMLRQEATRADAIGLKRTSASFGAEGGSGTIEVTSACKNFPWQAYSHASWITIESKTAVLNKTAVLKKGPGSIRYTVHRNHGLEGRTGIITVGGHIFTVTQEAGKVATPTFSPAPGTYTGSVTVTISCATSGATIRYTTNGTDPTSSSSVYSSPLTFTTTTTLKARAFKSGMTPSDVATGTYTVSTGQQVAAQIVGYNAAPRQVKVGESVTLTMTLKNTGTTSWTFYGAVSLRKPGGALVHLIIKPINLNVGQEGSVSWNYSPDVAGSWDVVFGVWKESTQQNSLGHTGWLIGYITVSLVSIPRITVTSPNGGEVWAVGSTRTISWASANLSPSGQIYIFYWYNNAWQQIAGPLTPSTTSYSWTVPNTPTTSTKIWVGCRVGGNWECSDESDQSFTIQFAPAPSIRVTSPNGGEVWTVGSTRTISWTSSNLNPAGRIYVYYWYNNGWVQIAGPLPTSSSSFSWSVPSIPSTVSSVTSFVLVGNYVNGVWETQDMSDQAFTIVR
jgi:hypothetical protein